MEKINKTERINLIHALMAASNAFHDKLKKYGYKVSYGLDNSKIGSIRKLDILENENLSLGDLSIIWKIKE